MQSIHFKLLSVLLSYPEQELIDHLSELEATANSLTVLEPFSINLSEFFQYLRSQSLIELQETYVHTFDQNRSHALYIFEHVYGEDRDRGSAMVDLLNEYHNHGFYLGDDELPDYLPVLLEFLSQVDEQYALKLLGDAVHVIEHIRQKLASSHSVYQNLLFILVALSPVKPQKLTEPPVRDMDEAMEMFGPDATGTEPLVQNNISTVQFYPNKSQIGV